MLFKDQLNLFMKKNRMYRKAAQLDQWHFSGYPVEIQEWKKCARNVWR